MLCASRDNIARIEKIMCVNTIAPFSITTRDATTRPSPCVSPCIVDNATKLKFQKIRWDQEKICVFSFLVQLLLIHSLAHPCKSWAVQDASTLPTLLASNSKYCSTKGKWKKWWELMLFYVFALEFTSRPIIEAMAAWPTLIGHFWPRSILTHSPSSLFV